MKVLNKMEAKEIKTLIDSLERHLEVSQRYLSQTYNPHSDIEGSSLLHSYDIPLLEGFIEGLKKKVENDS